ncbi:hypothetical protein SDC9_163767 [bioreactor metagenome]|uniref:Uncharacterized protein n=1 Tax=bioreactor metagenome TaxID=1076179 RepID=A0A645FPT4_9ZZZZ
MTVAADWPANVTLTDLFKLGVITDVGYVPLTTLIKISVLVVVASTSKTFLIDKKGDSGERPVLSISSPVEDT